MKTPRNAVASVCAAATIAAGAACGDFTSPGGAATDPPRPPGALIGVRVDGRVAVLLEDFPEALRDRAASIAAARPAELWRERARRQLDHTHMKLTFRRYYYPDPNKGALPLPPRASWSVALDPAGPSRTTIDGHDVVAIQYTLTTTLLSDADSPERAEPALAEIGGAWEEAFILPADPELLFQRTGYACMREDETPPHSVDGENAWIFYDEDCLPVANGQLNCHVTVPSWPEGCQDALERRVGRVNVAVRYERLPWDDALADAARVGSPTAETPDLRVIPEGLANNRITYRYIPADSCAIQEGCVGGPGFRRLLQFDANVQNTGKQAIEVGSPLYGPLAEHNNFEWSPCHEHFHFRFYGSFHLSGAAAGDGMDEGSKRAFCLLSTTRYDNNEATPLLSPHDSCNAQGISPGWGDDYYAGLDCQWLDITGVDTSSGPTDVTLGFRSNPDQFICEGEPVLDAAGQRSFERTAYTTARGDAIDRPRCDFAQGWDAANYAATTVTVPSEGGMVTEPCARGQQGPLRDCGFTKLDDKLTCVPGEEVVLACSVASAGAPQLLRVCEASKSLGAGIACVSRDALSSAVVDTDGVTLTFVCPPARDVVEVGGGYALYGSAAFDDDITQPITCAPI